MSIVSVLDRTYGFLYWLVEVRPTFGLIWRTINRSGKQEHSERLKGFSSIDI